MKKWIQDLFGITQIINERKKQTEILNQIYKECKRNSNLVESYNSSFHIKNKYY